VSPAIRYGIIPAKVIRALAWLRICCYHRRRQKKKNKKYYPKKIQWLFFHMRTQYIYAFNPNVECIRYTYIHTQTYKWLVLNVFLSIVFPLRFGPPHHVLVLHAPLWSPRGARRRPLQALVLREQDVHGGQQDLGQIVADLETHRAGWRFTMQPSTLLVTGTSTRHEGKSEQWAAIVQPGDQLRVSCSLPVPLVKGTQAGELTWMSFGVDRKTNNLKSSLECVWRRAGT